MFVGYARVSTADQKLDAQLDALRAAGCVTIYSEKMSGATTERPELQRLLSQIRPGEILTITALDRLARSATDQLQLASLVVGERISVHSKSRGATRPRPWVNSC